MAIVQNPITGKTRGKFATAVFSYTYEKNIMRAKVVQYHDKQSQSQLNLRSRFILLQRIASFIIVLIRIGFKFDSYVRSAYASFISFNSQFFDFNVEPNINNYHLLQFSQGTRLTPDDYSCTIDFNNKTCLASWNLPTGGGTFLSDDELNLVFCDVNFTQFCYYKFCALRSDESVNISLPSNFYDLTDVLNYAFFSKNHNSVVQKQDIATYCSNTVYVKNSKI